MLRTTTTPRRPPRRPCSPAWHSSGSGLIQRFIDRAATFAFAGPGVSHRSRTSTFDMFEGDFTHDGDRCTFEGLCARFGLRDPRLPALAELVHDLDVKDGRYGRADAPLLGALVEGLRLVHDDDQDLLAHGIALFEACIRATPCSAPRPLRRRRHGRIRGGRRVAPDPGIRLAQLSAAGALAYRSYAMCRSPALPLFAREQGASRSMQPSPKARAFVRASGLRGLTDRRRDSESGKRPRAASKRPPARRRPGGRARGA